MSDSENRKRAAIDLARELYLLMPGVDQITVQGEHDWPTIEVTKAYNFCMLIAASIIAADCRTFK